MFSRASCALAIEIIANDCIDRPITKLANRNSSRLRLIFLGCTASSPSIFCDDLRSPELHWNEHNKPIVWPMYQVRTGSEADVDASIRFGQLIAKSGNRLLGNVSFIMLILCVKARRQTIRLGISSPCPLNA
jgi:hypothetical protein